MTILTKRQSAVKSRGPSADAFSALAVQILSLAGALQAAGDTLTRPSGQSAARWRVLAVIENQPDTVAGIARRLQLARQSVQRIADLLATEHLAEYRNNPAHTRAKLVSLTPDGRVVLRNIQSAQAVWAQRVADGLEPDRVHSTCEVLADVLDRVNRIPHTEGQEQHPEVTHDEIHLRSQRHGGP
jgi:DNA-binding MarR family transcriptional regulator